MNLSSSRLKKVEQYDTGYSYNRYMDNSLAVDKSVIEGDFYQEKPMTIREMITRKINKSLCFCLGVSIMVTFVSYYISMHFEAKLNNLDAEIVRLNAENQDLQAELDRFKSFNNVDNKIGEFKLLQKAEKVIEVTALNAAQKPETHNTKTASNTINWAIGY